MLLKEKHVLSTASHRTDSVVSESSTAKFLTHADFVKDDKTSDASCFCDWFEVSDLFTLQTADDICMGEEEGRC